MRVLQTADYFPYDSGKTQDTQGKTGTSRMNHSLEGEGRPSGLNAYNSPRRCTSRHAQKQPFNYTQREARESTYTHRQVGLCSLGLTPIPHLQTLLLQVASCWVRKHCFQTYAHILMPTETTSLRDYEVTADKDTETKQQ